MNRRKMFSFLPAGLLGLLGSSPLKAQVREDDMWVEVHCEHKVDDGRVFIKPYYSRLQESRVERGKIIGCSPDVLDREQALLEEEKREYERRMKKWISLPICNAHYKRLRGTRVSCPKCGVQPSGGNDRGILI